MRRWKRSSFLVGASFVVVASLLLPAFVHGQGYGAQDDDDFASNQQAPKKDQIPQNQQISALPQYDSVEQAGESPQGQTQAPQPQPSGPSQGSGPSNMWWQGQNAFQRPPGHPGVEQLAPNNNAQPQAPAQPQHQPGNNLNFNQPAPNNYNAYGGGAPPAPQFNNQPQNQPFNNNNAPPSQFDAPPQNQPFNNPPPQPQQNYQQPQFNSPPPPQQGPFNRPPTSPQQSPQGQSGWGAPQQQHQFQAQPAGFGQNPQPLAPPQNYQPPPLNPAPFLPQQNFQPQQPVPPTIQSYRPPPAAPAPPPPPPPQQPFQQQPRPSNSYNPQPQPFNPPTQPQQQRPVQNQPPKQPEAPAVPYPGCPAAMLCVQDEYCNAIGLIEESPVQFSAADRLHRVALMQCSEPMTGIVGVCCRDPNYKDPWPDMQGGGMKPNHQHHPDRGQNQGQKSPFFQPQQPPQGNHLANPSGGPTNPNPYSGQPSGDNGNNNYGWTRNRNNAKCNNLEGSGSRSRYINNKNQASKNQIASGSSSSTSAESKQTLQVLEPCSSNELCISMSQCHSLNPEFMEKTGLNPSKVRDRNNLTDSSEPVKIKRCKYERSGVHYLCCKKPERRLIKESPTTTPSVYRPFFIATTKKPPARFTFGTTPNPNPTSSPTNVGSPFQQTIEPPSTTVSSPLKFTSFYQPTTSTKSTLITGVGLRFHSGLHTEKQKELNSKKASPYKENEQPILLISPRETTTTEAPFIFSPSQTQTHSFRFTTTSTTPLPPFDAFSEKSTRFGNSLSFKTSQTVPAFARVVGTTRSYISSTTPFTSAPLSTTFLGSNNGRFPSTKLSLSSTLGTSPFTFSTPKTTDTTTPTPTTTTTEGKVDISKIPVAVPLRKDLKADPPIGFIFKGDDLFIPELQVPSQNYLVPINDFEERTFPTETPFDEVNPTLRGDGEQSTNNLSEGTTIYSVLDDINNSHETGG